MEHAIVQSYVLEVCTAIEKLVPQAVNAPQARGFVGSLFSDMPNIY
jgi:hypothetical protein